MSKALLMILPLPEDTLYDYNSKWYIGEVVSLLIGYEKYQHASFLGVVDGDYPQDAFVLKNRAGNGGAQPLSVLEYHIAKTYKKEPEEKEETYGTYY